MADPETIPKRPTVPKKPVAPDKPQRSAYSSDKAYSRAMEKWQKADDEYKRVLMPEYTAALKAQQEYDLKYPPRDVEKPSKEKPAKEEAPAPAPAKPAAKPANTIYDLNGNPLVKTSTTWPAQTTALLRGISEYNAPARPASDAELHRRAIDREVTDAAVASRMKGHMAEDAAYKGKFNQDLELQGQKATQQGFNQEVMRQFPAAFAAVPPPPRAIYNPVRAAQTMPPPTFAPRPMPTPDEALARYAPRPQPTEAEMLAKYAPKDQATEEEMLKRYALLDTLKGY